MKEIESKSLESALHWAEHYFAESDLYFGHGTDNAWDEAVLLASYCLNKVELTTQDLSYELLQAEQTQFQQLCQKRVRERIPAAYLIGEMYFAGLAFEVNEHVLVPRSPLAELIGSDFKPWIAETGSLQTALDLCTGSGCIGLALAHYFPQLQVDLIDISKDALAVSKRNIQKHQLAERVQAIESDLFQAVQGKRYDLILSNPPYVSEQSWQSLPEEFKHEPKLGFVAENQGLAIVEKILAEARQHLTDKGVLIVEVGELMPVVMEQCARYPLTWLSFEHGGEGVFLISAEDL